MTVLVTRCPQCETSFRLKPAHLNSAKGAVRCGSCLHIFIAREHLVTRTANKAASKVSQPNLEVNPEPDARVEADPEAQLETAIKAQPEPEPEPEPESESENYVETKTETNSEPVPRTETSVETPDTEDDNDDDPGWTQSDFESVFYQEDDPSKNEPPPDGYRTHSSDDIKPFNFQNDESDATADNKSLDDEDLVEKDIAAFTFSESFIESTSDASTSSSGHDSELLDEGYGDTLDGDDNRDEDDESWAAKLLEGLDEEEVHTNAQEGPLKPSEEQVTNFSRSPFEELSQEESSSGLDTTLAEDSSQAEPNWLDELEPETLEIETPLPAKRMGKNHLWAILSLFAALGLVGQFAGFKFDTYSRIEPWRSGYQWACSLGLCTLPDLGDKSKISAYNLLVRTHPSAAKALIVDAIILNSAAFSQAFPELQLIFSDSSNRIVASRRFKPYEYLAGELAGQNTMPRQQPIHITLELVDPGPEAMGYSIHIR